MGLETNLIRPSETVANSSISPGQTDADADGRTSQPVTAFIREQYNNAEGTKRRELTSRGMSNGFNETYVPQSSHRFPSSLGRQKQILQLHMGQKMSRP